MEFCCYSWLHNIKQYNESTIAACDATFDSPEEKHEQDGIRVPANFTLEECKRLCCIVDTCNAVEYDSTIGDCWVVLTRLKRFVLSGNRVHYRLVQRHENRSQDTGARGVKFICYISGGSLCMVQTWCTEIESVSVDSNTVSNTMIDQLRLPNFASVFQRRQ